MGNADLGEWFNLIHREWYAREMALDMYNRIEANSWMKDERSDGGDSRSIAVCQSVLFGGDFMKTHYTLKTGTLIHLILFALAAGAGILFATQKTVFSWTATTISAKEQVGAAAEPTNSLQQEKKKMGRPVVHFEIGCRDQAKTNEFYSKLFDWQIQQLGPAGFITTGEGGIPGHTTSLGHEPHNYVTVYVQVDDLKAYLEKAAALGGKMLVPPVEIPTGRFAWMADPEGNIIGLMQPKSAPAK